MRVLIVTDAWRPQVNGVVRTIEHLIEHAPLFGVEVVLLTPDAFRTMPMPTYPEIRLSLVRARTVGRMIEDIRPDHIHVSTEGTLGLAARRACLRAGYAFTTSYHTKFPEYLRKRIPVPERWTYAWLRRFHNAGDGIMVATPSLEKELTDRGFKRLMRWPRGVDGDHFKPRPGADAFGLKRPIFLYVGRVSSEKNIEAFLSLDLPGSKVVVGDGPERAALTAKFPDTHFAGVLTGEALAQAYSSSDVFVFPSKTDTFGIVILEALASGLPVAAYPVTGPIDILDPKAGALDEDLKAAALKALELSGDDARRVGVSFGWQEASRMFFDNAREVMRRRPFSRASAMPRPGAVTRIESSVPPA